MTAPANLPHPPAVYSGDFQGKLVPPDVQTRILSMLVDSAPFAASLTRQPTNSASVVYPLASPSGAAWIAELDEIPLMSLNDDAYTVAVAKLAGLLDVSNELIHDSNVNLTAQLRTLLSDSLGPQLDDGLLNGSGPPEPAGVVAVAPPVTMDDTLFAAANAAKGEIADAGGAASHLAASGTAFAGADGSVGSDGHLAFPSGVGAALGLTPVTVPGLSTPLVYDARRIFAVVNGALSDVAVSEDFRFQYDAVTLRIKARVACACPVPDKTIRKLVAGP